MNYQVWISKKTTNGEQSNELGFFSPEHCKANYQLWVDTARSEGFEQLVLNPIGLDRTSDKRIVIKL